MNLVSMLKSNPPKCGEISLSDYNAWLNKFMQAGSTAKYMLVGSRLHRIIACPETFRKPKGNAHQRKKGRRSWERARKLHLAYFGEIRHTTNVNPAIPPRT